MKICNSSLSKHVEGGHILNKETIPFKDKSMNIAGCGCLLGLLIGFILVVAMVFSGSMIRNLKGILILIPLLGLFCGSVPMLVLSPDKEWRVGAGCICYPLLIYMILAASLDRGRIAWEWIAPLP